MKFPAFQFPQILRFFSATSLKTGFLWTEKLMLVGFIIALFSLNLLAKTKYPGPISVIATILTNPGATTPHVSLAVTLKELGLAEVAKKELRLAQEVSNVLGAESGPADLLTAWETEPLTTAAHIQFWKEIAQTKPDYRDAHLLLSYLSYESGNIRQARAFAQKAFAADPSEVRVQKLGDFFDGR